MFRCLVMLALIGGCTIFVASRDHDESQRPLPAVDDTAPEIAPIRLADKKVEVESPAAGHSTSEPVKEKPELSPQEKRKYYVMALIFTRNQRLNQVLTDENATKNLRDLKRLIDSLPPGDNREAVVEQYNSSLELFNGMAKVAAENAAVNEELRRDGKEQVEWESIEREYQSIMAEEDRAETVKRDALRAEADAREAKWKEQAAKQPSRAAPRSGPRCRMGS